MDKDTIYRQDAIDAMWKIRRQLQMLDDTHKADRVMHGIYLAKKALEQLPSVMPKMRTGKWYKPVGMMPPEYAGVYRCSECGEIAMRDWKHHKQVLSNFCPNCGADMRGEQDE